MKQVLVAGTRSGCGKTSMALGLMAALTRRGCVVAPFKSGPDFIDPAFHALACGRTSANLDPWMCGEEAVRGIFARGVHEAAGYPAERAASRPLIVVVEGAMGLFDGYAGDSDLGSAAHLARILALPVLLVADVASQARSALASVSGFYQMAPDLKFAGLALNRVAGESHAQLLRQAFAGRPDLKVLGCLPRQEVLATPSRHLGLVMPGEDAGLRERLGLLADWVETAVDLDGLLAWLPDVPVPDWPTQEEEKKKNNKSAGFVDDPADGQVGRQAGQLASQHALRQTDQHLGQEAIPGPGRLIAVARDEAFCFLYPENLRLLEAAGARLAFFSPLTDPALPEGAEALYLPGGYPELHAATLAANASLRAEIRDRCLAGLPAWGECGGFMYLCAAIQDSAGASHPMCGVFDCAAVLSERLASLGYREAEILVPSPLGPAGTMARGHEFHYCRLTGDPGPEARPGLRTTSRTGPNPEPQGFVRANTLGSWLHLHLASNPAVARALAGV